MAARTPKPSDLALGIKAGDRATLARAITLIESKRADHRKAAHLASPVRPALANPPPSTCSELI